MAENPLPCGCVIMGIPEIVGGDIQVLTYIDLNIKFCCLHATAPRLLEALKAVEWEGGDVIAVCPSCQRPQWPDEKHDRDCNLQAAIATAQPTEVE